MSLIRTLKEKRDFVFKETIKINKRMPEARVASSLSPLELFVCLYYGGFLKFNPKNQYDEERDRFIISKGHGSISLYPILADLGFFDKKELEHIGKNFLGSIPDPTIPGYETINGSLGHGLGVGTGIAIGLKEKKSNSKVVVLCGDGELYEGSVWEAIMFAGHNKINNLFLIVDNNKTCMLDRCKNVIDLEPLKDKFNAFGWKTFEIQNGHDLDETYSMLNAAFQDKSEKPKAVIANTTKGKGIERLEKSPISHILPLTKEEIEKLL